MMGLEPHSKIVVNCSPTTLIIIVDHSWLDLALSSFSMFVWIIHSISINAIWTYLDLFSSLSIILSFLILFVTFLSIAFCFKLPNIGLMWPHANWNSLLMTLCDEFSLLTILAMIVGPPMEEVLQFDLEHLGCLI